jgi:4-amino-4-deoxy-L-arabinose transferase-like glycosyltransferase
MLHIRYTFIYFPSIILIVAIFWDQTTLLKRRGKAIVFSLVFISILVNFFFINDYSKGSHEEPWMEIATDISLLNSQLDNEIYTEQSFYLNYFLKMENHKDALSIQKPNDEYPFWYLVTPYDNGKLITEGYTIMDETDYGKGFVLYYFEGNAMK